MATPLDKYIPNIEDVNPDDLEQGYNPADAEKLAKDENASVLVNLTADEKDKLLKMCKHGEFNQRESAILKVLLGSEWNLNDIGAFLGAASPKTQGKPMSRPAALKELNRIENVVVKRYKQATGKDIDLSAIPKLKRQMKKNVADKKREKWTEERKRKELMREFWKELKEVNRVRRSLGLPPDFSLVPRARHGQSLQS